jgi:hypothetical protein
LTLLLRCGASLFVGLSLRILSGAALRFLLGRDASYLLGSTHFLFGLTLLLRCGASLFIGLALRFLGGAAPRLSLCRNASFFSAASRAHDNPNDRGCERKTNPADDEKHLHDRGSSPPILAAYGRATPLAIAARAPTEIGKGVGTCLLALARRPTFGHSAFRGQHAHRGARGRHVRCP